MCAPLGNIDKSDGLLRPEAFSALGNYGVSVCIFPEEQRHALPDLSALQTGKPSFAFSMAGLRLRPQR